MVKNITVEDFDFIYHLYMHPTINPYLLYEQLDAAAFIPVYNDLLSRKIAWIFSVEGINTGMFKLIPQQYRNSHIAYLGGLAIHPHFAGQRNGLKMMNEIIELGKSMNIIRIELSVATFNSKAIHLYEKVGFVKEGVLRKYTHLKSENRFIDEVMMSLLYE